MSKNLSFFNLPSVVSTDIFTRWTESKDLAKLDSAVANEYQRTLFLEMLRDPFFVLQGSDSLVLHSYLTWLSLRGVKVDKVALVTSCLDDSDMVSNMDLSKLESLSFKNCNGVHSKSSELSFLQRLINFAVKTDPYMKLFVRCANLKHVDFGDEAHSSFGKIGMFCAKLQSMKAVHCNGLNDTAIENIAQHCRTNIRTVILRACDQLTSASVYAVAENCPNLTYIDLSYGSTHSERCLIQLAEQCPLLEFVNFEGLRNISDKVIATVAQHCKNLTYFNIDYYKGMSHEGIDPVALKLIAESCTNIQDFIAPDFHYKVRQNKSQLLLKGVYTRLPKLRNILLNAPVTVSSLNTSGCKYFNNECIQIAAERFHQHLLALHIAGCDDVTDAGMLHVATHCRLLEHIDLSRCADLTAQSLTHLHSCTHLQTVLLKKCAFVTDISVAELVQHLPLTKLDLHSCTITDVALQAIGTHGASLRELDVCGCDNVTKAGVQSVIVSVLGLTCQNFWQFYL